MEYLKPSGMNQQDLEVKTTEILGQVMWCIYWRISQRSPIFRDFTGFCLGKLFCIYGKRDTGGYILNYRDYMRKLVRSSSLITHHIHPNQFCVEEDPLLSEASLSQRFPALLFQDLWNCKELLICFISLLCKTWQSPIHF